MAETCSIYIIKLNVIKSLCLTELYNLLSVMFPFLLASDVSSFNIIYKTQQAVYHASKVTRVEYIVVTRHFHLS